jgi:hypothetical protein
LTLVCSVGLLGISSCYRPVGERQSHGGPIADQVSLVDHLRLQGYTVEIAGEVAQPFLRHGIVRSQELAEAAELQAYNYADDVAGPTPV